MKKLIIYLDTKFIIGLAEKKEKGYKDLFSFMEKKQDNIIIPTSAPLFYEISRIQNTQRRISRSEILVKFSKGLGVKAFTDTLQTEINDAVLDFCNKKSFTFNKHPLCGYKDILGKIDFPDNLIDSNFFEMVEMMQDSKDIPGEEAENQDWALKFNELKQKNTVSDKNKNYDDIFKKMVVDCFPLVVPYVFLSMIGAGKNPREEGLIESFVQSKSFFNIPFFKILAHWHNEKFSNDNGAIESNDYEDFQHLYAALSSCDIFATERHLKHISSSVLNFDKEFNTKIIQKPHELLDIIKNI